MTTPPLPEDPASLAQQLADLNVKVGQLQAAVKDLPEIRARQKSYAALVRQVTDLRDKVSSSETTALRQIKRVSEALKKAMGEGKVQRPQAPYLADLTQAEYDTLIGELQDWVNIYLRPMYEGYELRECWANHMEALSELTWLHAEWKRVYGDPDDRPLEDAIRFHDRLLPGVLARLASVTTCSPGGDCQAVVRRRKRRGAGTRPAAS